MYEENNFLRQLPIELPHYIRGSHEPYKENWGQEGQKKEDQEVIRELDPC